MSRVDSPGCRANPLGIIFSKSPINSLSLREAEVSDMIDRSPERSICVLYDRCIVPAPSLTVSGCALSCRYFENRQAALKGWSEAGVSPYPHKFDASMRVPAFVEAFKDVPVGSVLEEVTVSIAGRMMASRSSSAKLQFYDLHGEGAKVQVMFNASYAESPESYEWARDNVRRGDIIGVVGHPGKTKLGELSIVPRKITILTPCLHMMPKGFYGLKVSEPLEELTRSSIVRQ